MFKINSGGFYVHSSSASTTGRIAIALAVLAIIGLIFIILFYALIGRIENPFGTLNDICVALGGILSGWLAWKLHPLHRSYAPPISRFALGLGFVGACLVPLGSALVILNFTGWFLAGLISTFGYAMIGLWLLLLNYSALHWLAFPRRLAQYGIITGSMMGIGLFAAPAILAHIDTMETAEWFVLLALFAGGFGWNILYTIWCLWLSFLLLTNQ